MAQLSQRQIVQTLKQEAKQVLRENGMSTSGRRANKELAYTLKRLAHNPYSSLDEVSKAGQELGQEIVKLSQERNKQNLDGGVLRLMSPAALASGVPSAGKTKSAQTGSQSAPPAAAEPKSEPAPASAPSQSGPATPASDATSGSDLAADNEPEPAEVVADVEVAEDTKSEAQTEAEARSQTLTEPEPAPELSSEPDPKAAAETSEATEPGDSEEE